MILIGSEGMGSSDEKLGHILLGNFLRILGDREVLPKYIILWNSGVKNAAKDSDTLDHLKTLQERGVEIISCRTCVEYFGLENEMAAGVIDGMARILEILASHQVLTI
ncbi:MAG: DsrE family protein [Armatimonadota bacterium]